MKPEIRRLFDEPLCREGTFCSKWDDRERLFHSKDALPMWVADMDFRTAPGVINALVERAQHGAFGYESYNPAFALAVQGWQMRRHGLHIETDWLLPSPGVVDSLYMCVETMSQPEEYVLVNTPLYGPFFSAITGKNRKIFDCPMLYTDGVWRMDFDRIEEGLKAGSRLFLLCNPHNPVGRVWDKEELIRLIDLCHRYGARVVSDEIHSDFIRAGHKHAPILSLDPTAVQLISSTKTFNLAAMRYSQIIVADKELRSALNDELRKCNASTGIMGRIAQEAAFRTGDEWVDGLNEYLDEAREMMETFVKNEMPGFELTRSQGTYLLWLDARCLNLSDEDIVKVFVEKAGICPNRGDFFGENGKGFLRINIATPHANIRRAMEGMAKAFGK